MVSFNLAKKGYFNGDPVKVLEAPVDIVIGLLRFEESTNEYETTYMELNKNASDR